MTMNFVALVKFFYIICDAIIMFLLDVGQIVKELFRSISNYFAIVEINNCKILQLHCLVWLRDISHLVTLQFQIQSNIEFHQ